MYIRYETREMWLQETQALSQLTYILLNISLKKKKKNKTIEGEGEKPEKRNIKKRQLLEGKEEVGGWGVKK